MITSTKTNDFIHVILANQINLAKKRNRKVRCAEHFVTLSFTPLGLKFNNLIRRHDLSKFNNIIKKLTF